MKIQYVLASECDREFFVRTHHGAYREAIEKMFGWDENIQDAFANKAFDEGDIYIILFKGERIGVVGWEDQSDYFWFKQFYLLPQYQNQGIGGMVIEDIVEKAKLLEKDIHLRTLRSNLKGKRFYEKFGFQLAKTTDTHFRLVFKNIIEQEATIRL